MLPPASCHGPESTGRWQCPPTRSDPHKPGSWLDSGARVRTGRILLLRAYGSGLEADAERNSGPVAWGEPVAICAKRGGSAEPHQGSPEAQVLPSPSDQHGHGSQFLVHSCLWLFPPSLSHTLVLSPSEISGGCPCAMMWPQSPPHMVRGPDPAPPGLVAFWLHGEPSAL